LSSNYWLKLWHEMLDDPKMGRLTDRQYRRFVELLLLAGDYDQDGLLPSYEDIEFRLRTPEGLHDDMEYFYSITGLLSTDGIKSWITNWKKRQEAMTETERSKRWREKQRKDEYYYNEDETKAQRNVRRSRSRKEVEVEVEREVDVEVVSSNNLSNLFSQLTKLNIKDDWKEAEERLIKAGVIENDIKNAVQDCNKKGFNIVGLRSIVNPAIIAMNNRMAKHPDNSERHKESLKRYGI